MHKPTLLAILSVGFLTACAPPPKPPESLSTLNGESTLTHSAKTNATTITSWEISGAMAARNNKKSWTASVNWLERGPSQYQIRLSGPLGGGAVMIEKTGGVVSFVDGAKKASSQHADELLEQHTGIRLPVNNLYYWVRGLPAPGSRPITQYDAAGHLVLLKQAGYTINYSNYSTANHVDLPGKIQLYGHNIAMKLVIQQWKV